MFHRGCRLGRLVLLILFIFGAITVTRGLYRSGYEKGFISGMAFSAADGAAVSDAPALPEYGRWNRSRLGPIEGGFMGFGFLGLAFFAFLIFMAMGHAGRRRHWARHHGWHGHDGMDHGPHQHRPSGPPGMGGVGPEKKPEEYL